MVRNNAIRAQGAAVVVLGSVDRTVNPVSESAFGRLLKQNAIQYLIIPNYMVNPGIAIRVEIGQQGIQRPRPMTHQKTAIDFQGRRTGGYQLVMEGRNQNTMTGLMPFDHINSLR